MNTNITQIIRIAIGVAMVVAIAIGYFFFRGPDQTVTVGVCLDGRTGDVRVVECDSDDARYRVTEELGVLGPFAPSEPNCAEGEPFALSTEKTTRGFEPIYCLVSL